MLDEAEGPLNWHFLWSLRHGEEGVTLRRVRVPRRPVRAVGGGQRHQKAYSFPTCSFSRVSTRKRTWHAGEGGGGGQVCVSVIKGRNVRTSTVMSFSSRQLYYMGHGKGHVVSPGATPGQ